MPSKNIVYTESVVYPGKYVIHVTVTKDKETYKQDFAEVTSLLQQARSKGQDIIGINFYDYFFDVDASELRDLFEEIKKSNISEIGLMQVSGYGLGYFTNPNIQATFELMADACINGHVQTVDLTRNGIGKATPEKQDEIMRGLLTLIPHVRELNLSENGLEKLGHEKLQTLFAECSKSEKLLSLYLSSNGFCSESCDVAKIGGTTLELINLLFNERKYKWEQLSLSFVGDIICFTREQWKTFLAQVGNMCERLDLSYNDLQTCTNEGEDCIFSTTKNLEEDVVDILIKIMETKRIQELNLSHNNFSSANTQKLRDVASKQGILLNVEGNDYPNNEGYYEDLRKSQEIKNGGKPLLFNGSDSSPLSKIVTTNDERDPLNILNSSHKHR